MQGKWLIILACLFSLTGCASVCGRLGPDDCRGVVDCYYTKMAFERCCHCPSFACKRACNICEYRALPEAQYEIKQYRMSRVRWGF